MKTCWTIVIQILVAITATLPSSVTDAWTGPRMRKSSVSTTGPLAFSNPISTIRFNRKWQFEGSGGSTPYTFSKVSGSGTVAAGGLYTAPNASSDSTVVRLTDNASTQVNNTLAVSIPTITLTDQSRLITAEPQGVVVDSGGTGGNYSNNEWAGVIIRSTEANTPITITFETFNTESGYDYLYVFDGEDWGTLLGQYSGSSLPPTLTANSGSMMVWWEADGGAVAAGFKARWNIGPASVLSTLPYHYAVDADTDVAVTTAGGTGPYTYSIVSGGGTITQSADPFVATLHPPAGSGSVTYRITDATSATVDRAVSYAPAYTMCSATTSSTSSEGVLYDDGGPNANYTDNKDCGFTITPSSPGASIELMIDQLSTEDDADYIDVYDGTGTNGTLLASFHGGYHYYDTRTSLIALSGSIYVNQYTDGGTTNPGFRFYWKTQSTYPYTWTGGGGNANWTTGANWLGGAAPPANTIALFDNTCSSNCSPTINANISIAGIFIRSGYTGTITQGAGSTISLTGEWVQNAGTFIGSASAITINKALKINGGSFTSTSGTLTFGTTIEGWDGDTVIFTVGSGATFNHNSGTILDRSSRVDSASSVLKLDAATNTTFNNFTIDDANCSDWWYLDNGSYGGTSRRFVNMVRINGTLTHNCAWLEGVIQLYGNLVVGPNARPTESNGNVYKISFMGSANQTYGRSGTGGWTTDLAVNKTGGTLTSTSTDFGAGGLDVALGTFTAPTGVLDLGNHIITNSNVLTVASGQTFAHNGGTVNFSSWVSDCNYFDDTLTIDVPTTLTLNNVAINGGYDGCYGNHSILKLTTGDSIVVNGSLTMSGGYMDGGTWIVNSNITLDNAYFTGGTSAITMAGAANSSISYTAGTFPGSTFTINKSTGAQTVTLNNNITVAPSMVVTTGTVLMSNKNLTIPTSLSLNGNTVTKGGGILKVNGSNAGTGALFGGTVNP